MRLKDLIFNRVILGMLLFFVLIGVWEFSLKPQYRPSYDSGLKHYRNGDYQAALVEFTKAYDIARNNADVVIMMGWTHLKLRRLDEAKFFFDRAITIDPRAQEARLGASFVALETGKGEIEPSVLEEILKERSSDPDVMILAAAALQRQGKNLEAASHYRSLVDDKSYSKEAREALQQIFGLEGFNDPVPGDLAELKRPAQLQFLHKAAEGALWMKRGSSWDKFYVLGANLGPAAPGYFPGQPPVQGSYYTRWLRFAEQANANVIRAYTLLPPAFYRAYRHHVQDGGKIRLYQQIWVGDPPGKDLYDTNFAEETRREIRFVVDAMHGRGDVPPKYARGSGIYENNIAVHVAALMLGRELEASVVLRTDLLNPGKNKFEGKYITVSGGTPTEVWFAEMLDYLVGYETDTYNWQHPVAIVNWPPLDPLRHPTEASIAEEVRIRVRRGEALAAPKEIEDDNDTASLDESKFHATTAYPAGLFASYHVYPYYPDFLILDPQYLNARDSQGPNPMFGYLKRLKEKIPHPLVISEYGVPSSIGISHFHPYGWHHGGHNEQQQGELLSRFTRSIRESGCAGSVVFSLIDEWYKHNWLAVDFEQPLERTPMWLNELDPEKRYGLVGFRTSRWKLFSGDAAAWSTERRIYQSSGTSPEGMPTVESMQVSEDEAFLYLRLNLNCLDCRGPGRRPDGKPDFDQAAFAVAINTAPALAGVQQMPFGNLTLTGGANFLLYLRDPGYARLLVADNYNPYRIMGTGVGAETELGYRRGLSITRDARGSFDEFIVETNRQRYGRDGTVYRGQRYSRSVLRYGSGNPSAPDFDSLAEWHADLSQRAIIVRIPWGKLLVTDPSSSQVFAGIDESLRVRVMPTPGLDLTVFTLLPRGAGADLGQTTVTASMPPAKNGKIDTPQRYVLRKWQKVAPEPYLKKAYYAIQKEFLEQSRKPVASGAGAAAQPGSAGARRSPGQ
ncbi:MAG: tetratricopeptide repeat protein [Acidobacteria bacterium]|nr:tetratricopeptide repeat protein [Acidobacteriota bacterium]